MNLKKKLSPCVSNIVKFKKKLILISKKDYKVRKI